MWELALAGGIVVLVAFVTAIVIIGLKALNCARQEDVPAVTDSIMRMLRDSRQTVQRRLIPDRDRTDDQANFEGR